MFDYFPVTCLACLPCKAYFKGCLIPFIKNLWFRIEISYSWPRHLEVMAGGELEMQRHPHFALNLQLTDS